MEPMAKYWRIIAIRTLLSDFAKIRQELSLAAVLHSATLCHAAKQLLRKRSSPSSSPAPMHAPREAT
jgi:hypothetical protein